MLCFFGVLDSGKCLQTESLTNFIRIHSIIRCICKIVKSEWYPHHVCPLGMTQLPLGIFSWNFCGKICWESSAFITVRQELWVIYMKTNIHFCSYLTHFFLEWEMFHIKVVKKIKTHILFAVNYFLLNHAIDEVMWKNIVEPDRLLMTVWSMSIACWICKATNTHFWNM